MRMKDRIRGDRMFTVAWVQVPGAVPGRETSLLVNHGNRARPRDN